MKLRLLTFGVLFSLLAACGGGDEGPGTFDVNGTFGGTIETASRIHAGKSCEFFDGTVRVGEAIILKGASGQILGKAELTPATMEPIVCQMGFKFAKVPAGQAGYTLELESGTYPAVTATEQDLRARYANVEVRSATDVARAGGDLKTKVKMSPYNG